MLHIKEPLLFDDIKDLVPEKPERAGARWAGLPHAVVVKELRARAMTAKLGKPKRERFALGAGGLNCSGCLWFQSPVRLFNRQVEACVGFINQNDLRRPLTFFLGYQFKLAGFVTGSFRGGTHTINADFQEGYDDLERALGRLNADIMETAERLIEMPISKEQWVMALFDAAQEDYLPWSRVGQAGEDDAKLAPGSAFAAAYAFGKAVRRSSPFAQFDALERFPQLLRRQTLTKIG